MKVNRLAFFDAVEFDAGKNLPETSDGRQPPEEMLLVRYGRNTFTKNGQRGEFEFSEADADAVIAEFSQRGKDLVVDYDHQTLSGKKAPAAGWIESLTKTAQGLAGKIKYWTGEASNYLKNGEYRYISPVLNFSRRGKSVSALHSVALTNHPALHEMPALVADDQAGIVPARKLPGCSAIPAGSPHFNAAKNAARSKHTVWQGLPLDETDNGMLRDPGGDGTDSPVAGAAGRLLNPKRTLAEEEFADGTDQSNQGESTMNELLMLLGLVALADSPEDEQVEGIAGKVRELLEVRDDAEAFLALHSCESFDDLTGRIRGMLPAGEKNRLENELRKRDAVQVVGKAFSDGKLMENSRQWAMAFAEKDPEGFKSWAEAAPRVVPDNRDINYQEANASALRSFSSREKQILINLGLSDDQIALAETMEVQP